MLRELSVCCASQFVTLTIGPLSLLRPLAKSGNALPKLRWLTRARRPLQAYHQPVITSWPPRKEIRLTPT